MTDQEIPRNRKKKFRWGVTVLVLLLLATGACSAYFYHAYRKAVVDNPASQQRTIVEQVNSLVVVPTEEPQIATVKDASKLTLTSAALAQKAKNGDVLLVYNKAGQIVVYRPAAKKIVNMLTIQPSSNGNDTTAKKP